MCKSLHNLVIPLGLDFMFLHQYVEMSLNGLKRRVETHHKTLSRPNMDKLSIKLDS
jgi:hypothetical protein